MQISVIVELDNPEYIDEDHPTGITNEAYERLTAPFSSSPLGWLGEVVDVEAIPGL